jgi:hypothetical protein
VSSATTIPNKRSVSIKKRRGKGKKEKKKSTHRIPQSSLSTRPQRRIRIQQPLNETLRLHGYVLPIPLVELDFGFCRFADKLFGVFGAEGGVAAEEDVGYYAAGGVGGLVEDKIREGREGAGTDPVDQISTAFPCPALFSTSGATYPKLPASEWSCSSAEWRCFALRGGYNVSIF